MIKPLLRTLAFAPLSFLLYGCVDDSYDISNADTTTRVNINDLVLPVNIEPVRLGDVIKIDEGSKIQSVNIDGTEFYALVESGSFKSDPISINGVKASPGHLEPTRETLHRLINTDAAGGKRAPSGEYVYPLKEIGNYFSYDAVNIDEAIVSLDMIETEPFNFGLKLEIEDPNSTIGSMEFTDLKIRAPKGLRLEGGRPSVGSYDPESGYWIIPSLTTQNNQTSIALTAVGVNCGQAKVKINPDRSLDFNSEFHIESGYVKVEPKSVTFLDEVTFVVNYDLDEFEIKKFSGRLRYDLEGIDLDPVHLTDIPDFLKGEETSISIANPQIYLQINNPMAEVPLKCRTGLKLTALRDGLSPLTFELDDPVEIGTNHGVDGPYNFVLAPNVSDSQLQIPEGFGSNLDKHRFSTLGQLLTTPEGWSVKGLPDGIDIDLVDAGIPEQEVNGFSIPNNLKAAEGRYELMAPLALNDGSHIIYSEVRDGWNDDDVDAITVNRLQLTAHAVNNCPVSVQLTVYPIDKEGNQVDATVKSNTLVANSETDLNIELTGEVRHLDGIRLVAVLKAGENGAALSPEQTLSLENIRVTVSGYYETDF